MCVPARNKTLDDDMFDYAELSKIADRIFIMAYDQHWSTSKAGPVAALRSLVDKQESCKGLVFFRNKQDFKRKQRKKNYTYK